MNKKNYGKTLFGFSVIFVLFFVMVLAQPSVALTPNQLQMKNQIQKDIKKLEAQKDILIKRMQGYNKMRRKWKNDLDMLYLTIPVTGSLLRADTGHADRGF